MWLQTCYKFGGSRRRTTGRDRGHKSVQRQTLSDEQNSETLSNRQEGPSNDQGLLRNALFCALVFMWLGLSWGPLYSLAVLAVRSDPYSYTVLVPFVSLALLYWNRREILSAARFDGVLAALFFIVGVLFRWLSLHDAAALNPTNGPLNGLILSILSLVTLLIGSFALCYGLRAMRVAAFPLLFLFLLIPIPGFAVNGIISALQHWSADGTAILYNIFRVPALRRGLVFRLPGFSIIVAEECSGIRSTLALFITVLLVAQFSLKSNWRKLLLCLLVVPIAVAKNSIRIFALSTLAVYVDKSFLYGRLHRDGGSLFFLLGLAMAVGFLEFLQLWERWAQRGLLPSENQSKKAVPQTSAIC